MTSITDTQSATQPKTIAREVALCAGLVILTTVSAKVAIVLPWTPVPATLQVAAVIFAGSAFGPRRGFISHSLYLICGLGGLPVFAEPLVAGTAVTMLPTFGYLVAFPAAAWVAGHQLRVGGRWLSGLLGLGVVYFLGTLWLLGYSSTGGTESTIGWALFAGILTFLPFDLLKMGLAVWTATPVRKWVNGL